MAVALTSGVGRAVQKISGTPIFAQLGPKVIPRFDRLLHKVSGGRYISSSALVPSLMLNARGAKSGQPRQTPLATVPIGDAWYVVGSNFGRNAHPLWTGNLIAHPDVSISFDGSSYDVHAQLLTAEEKTAVWPELTKVWPNYDVYVERSQRDLRVFRLDRR
jgi:deazaflavin-dependent oxidoreductase (nitroreductase family)